MPSIQTPFSPSLHSRLPSVTHPEMDSDSTQPIEPINIKYKLYRVMAELSEFYTTHTTLNRSHTHSTAKRLLDMNESETATLCNHALTKALFAVASGVCGATTGFVPKKFTDLCKISSSLMDGLGGASDPLFNSWTSEVRALENHMKEIELSGSRESIAEANQSLEKLFNLWMTIQRNANHKG